jgi:hypothetical protein
MIRNYTFTLFFIVFISFNSKAQIETLKLDDSTLIALIFDENLNELNLTKKIDKINDSLGTLTDNDLKFISNILHKQNDLIYKNYIQELNVCYKLVDDYLLEYKDILKSFSLYSTPERTIFLHDNIKKYIGRLVFDFYFKNNRIAFLQEEIQFKTLIPSSINELLRNNYQGEIYISELKFISNNSQVLLFNN